MSKKNVFCILVGCSILLGAAFVCYGFVLMTKEQALKDVFPENFEVKAETVVLEGETLDRITKTGRRFGVFSRGLRIRESCRANED